MGVESSRLGPAIAAAVAGFSIPQDAWLTTGDLNAIWTAIAQEIDTEYSGFAEVAAGGFQVTVPAFGTHPVTGIGGPVS